MRAGRAKTRFLQLASVPARRALLEAFMVAMEVVLGSEGFEEGDAAAQLGQTLQAGEPSNGEPYARFALVTVTLNRLEWLDLSSANHIRCAFDRDGANWHGARLAP